MREDTQDFTDKLDVLRDMIKVHSRLKKDITEDFVLAKFVNDKDKAYIIDSIYNAYYCRQLVDKIGDKYKHWCEKCKFDKQLSTEDETRINGIGNAIFDLFLAKITPGIRVTY